MGWLAALPVVGDVLNYFSASDANRTNEAIANKSMEFGQMSAREQMNFQAQQASTARDFDERMANTQVQRRMADLRAAGINPLLAGTDGAAAPTSPAMVGASASGATTSVNPVESIPSRLFATALALQKSDQAAQSIKLTERDVTSKEMSNELQRKALAVKVRAMEVLDHMSSSALDLFNKVRSTDMTPDFLDDSDQFLRDESREKYGGIRLNVANP